MVKFHKAIAARAESSFFSLNGSDSKAERWTSLTRFEPDNMAGPWQTGSHGIVSNPFKLAAEQGRHDAVFIGGPCYLNFEKGMKGEWIPKWCPILYREVKLASNEDGFEITPNQGHWYLSPLVSSLIDRLQVSAGDDLDAFAREVVEDASSRRRVGRSIGHAIVDALIGKLPGLKEDLCKKAHREPFTEAPSSWVLFAPTSNFSALTRHLMADYNRLEQLLEKDRSNIGGLEVLEDSAAIEAPESAVVLPVTRLNNAQQRAVENILGNEALTVVSGPPGCGKSQVVLSVLLHAWANGKSVLFASNNNNAVDVVRKRLERFESEFPIAVRAGNRQKNNVVELLRKTLNYASGYHAAEAKDEANEAKRQKLSKERASYQEQLDGTLPQRAAEGLKTALKAYGEYQELQEKERLQKTGFSEKWKERGFDDLSPSEVQERVTATKEWIARAEQYKEKQKNDVIHLTELEDQLAQTHRKRKKILGEVGLDVSTVGNWEWLVDGPSVTLVGAWEKEFQEILTGQQEEALELFEWDSSFERWNTQQDAASTGNLAKSYSNSIRQQIVEISPQVAHIAQHERKLEGTRVNLEEYRLEEKSEISTKTLSDWLTQYSDYISRQSKKWDVLPWSPRSQIKRRMRQLERAIRPFIPIATWREIGVLDAEGGRERFSEVVELLRRWKEAFDDWNELGSERIAVQDSFDQLRATAVSLGLDNIPQEKTESAWNQFAQQVDDLAKLAEKAAEGIRKKQQKGKAMRLIDSNVRGWRNLGSGHPLKESWSKGLGAKFICALEQLREDPSQESLRNVRSAYYSGNLNVLKSTWEASLEIQVAINSIGRKIDLVPKTEARVKEWYADCPTDCLLSVPQLHDWPDFEQFSAELEDIEKSCLRYDEFLNQILPEIQKKAAAEEKWANEQLYKAIDILPKTSERNALEKMYRVMDKNRGAEWDVQTISKGFQNFSPEIIKAKIERIDAQLQKMWFQASKAQWRKRLQEDHDAVEAVDQLEKSMRRNRGKITGEHFEHFRRSLRVVPIWITTAQAAQAIPLEPKLFDLVIIDEASQCTLTNLLPLLYRGQRLAIIGDSEQLPAISTIQETEELSLAKKFEIEPFLTLIGHVENDVYAAAADALPRGRADVINLDEHFRSNPQIIGFSNRHIYHQRLVLKKAPQNGRALPIGFGVHKRHVNGLATRGERGRSWKNLPEAEEVMSLIEGVLMTSEMQHFSIGVVTPFSSQKELLRSKLQERGIASKILVDSAYGFQGDERDIMIFSPVVAPGITAGSSRWVESPPNLINVAITRARQALFVVADFDYCLRQDPSGILRKLANYCNDIQLLRDTSQPELELFSWMTIEGWTPSIHPRIGDVEVDFSLVSKTGIRLAVEVDGAEFHKHRQSADGARDTFLQAQGWEVMRIPAREVLEAPHNVIQSIKNVLRGD